MAAEPKETLTIAGQKLATIQMHVYEDHTYVWEFNANGYIILEKGSWNVVDGVVTFQCYKTVNTFELQEDGTYKMAYVAHRSSQMTQDYIITAEQFTATFGA